jgi:hypothetical protein
VTRDRLRLREKNGKANEMPCHHKLEEYLDAYIEAAGIADDPKGPLFRSAIRKTKKLTESATSRTDVWYMVRRRACTDYIIQTVLQALHRRHLRFQSFAIHHFLIPLHFSDPPLLHCQQPPGRRLQRSRAR